MKRLFLILIVSLLPAALFAQAKIYTRKAKLADFSQKTTKVVLTGDVFIDGFVRDEVSSCWHLSSFEFCMPSDYEKLKTNNGFYFLRIVKDADLMYLRLEKGGKETDDNTLRRPFEIVSIAIASAEGPSVSELTYISGYLDIIQRFTEVAMSSEGKAYMSLNAFASGSLKGRKILVDPFACAESFEVCEPGSAVAIVVAPHSGRVGAPYWLYVISCDTHDLLYVRRRVITQKSPAGLSAGELKKFDASLR